MASFVQLFIGHYTSLKAEKRSRWQFSIPSPRRPLIKKILCWRRSSSGLWTVIILSKFTYLAQWLVVMPPSTAITI